MLWMIFWIAIYLLIIIILTLKHIKYTNIEGYLVNNRKTSTFPLVATTLATFVGGGTSIGLMAMGYESGFAAIGIGIAYVIGFFILSRFAGKINRIGKTETIYTFPQFLIKRYAQQKNQSFSRFFSSIVSGVNIFIFFFLLAAQFVGMAALLKFAFEIGYENAVIIAAIVIILYTAFAGMAGVIITDLIQFLIIAFMIAVIFIPGIWSDTEHLTKLNTLPKDMLNGTFYGIVFIIALPIFLGPSVLIRMDIWQRMLAARNEKTAKKVSIISGLGMLPFYIIFPLVGMAIRITMGEGIKPKNVTYLFMEAHSNQVLLGFAVVGLLSALMSSGDSFLNLISISAVRDFSGSRKEKSLENNSLMQRQIRITTIVFGLIAIVMALILPRIVDLMVVGIATIVIFVPTTIYALINDEKAKNLGGVAMWSILLGFIVNLAFFIWGILKPEQFDPKSSFIPAFLTALTALVTGILLKKIKISK